MRSLVSGSPVSSFCRLLADLNQLEALGCSGSWVLVGGKFCGVIIACYQHEPYAHMATCDQLFDHTRDLILGAGHIKLPQAEKPVSWSNVGTSKSSSESCALNNSLRLNSMGSEVEKGPAYNSDYEEMKKLNEAIQSFLGKKSDIINKLKTILLKAQHLQAQQRLFPLHMTQAKREEATVMLRDVWRGMENISEVFEFWYSLTEDEMRAAAIVKTVSFGALLNPKKNILLYTNTPTRSVLTTTVS